MTIWALLMIYRNDPKFLDNQDSSNSVDPHQTTPTGAVWSGATLFAILSVLFGHITLWQIYIVQILGQLQQFFGVYKILGILR